MRARHSEERFYDPNWHRPEVVYGYHLLEDMVEPGERLAVATMAIPWNLAKDTLPTKPEVVVFARDMELRTLEGMEREVPSVDVVAGIGGGSSHDLAKYLALKKGARLVQVPTILSADAAVTSAIGIREGGKVKYIGHVSIDRILIDFSLIKQAPKELVRYGACDILSAHTASHDWRLAYSRGKEGTFDKGYYDKTREILDGLEKKCFDIREVNDEGIRAIVEFYLGFAEIAEKFQSDRAQEGSEHFFAYNVEYVTGRQYVHGKLLAIGILAMSFAQDNGFERILSLMADLGLEAKLTTIDLGRYDFTRALTTLKSFSEEGGYYYSIINETEFNEYMIGKLFNTLS